jgi:thioredoxin-related protein
MSYPTVVFMNGKFEMLSPVPGYQEPESFLKVAKYFGDNIYKETSWQDYSQQ